MKSWKDAVSRDVKTFKESFQNVQRSDPDVDDFQNLISSCLSKGTDVREEPTVRFYVKGLNTDKQTRSITDRGLAEMHYTCIVDQHLHSLKIRSASK